MKPVNHSMPYLNTVTQPPSDLNHKSKMAVINKLNALYFTETHISWLYPVLTVHVLLQLRLHGRRCVVQKVQPANTVGLTEQTAGQTCY